MLAVFVTINKELWDQYLVNEEELLREPVRTRSYVEFHWIQHGGYLDFSIENPSIDSSVEIPVRECLKTIYNAWFRKERLYLDHGYITYLDSVPTLYTSGDHRAVSHLFAELTRTRGFRERLAERVQDVAVHTGVQPQRLGHYLLLPLKVDIHPDITPTIDYAWSRRVCKLVSEYCEMNNVMAWLSTLGGAYSSLGDNFTQYAMIAGRISVEQLRISLQLGDPITASKCKIYAAISLMQRGSLTLAHRIIRQQYRFGMSFPETARDTRLINMCKGVWAKLKYIQQQKPYLP